MNPDGIIPGEEELTLYWLLSNVRDRIDLNRMSDTSRRDFPEGVRGSHMATKEETCFAECQIDRHAPPPGTYLLSFRALLRFADYRSVPSEHFTGQMYSPSHGYSQQVFDLNSGEYAALGLNSIRRYSARVHEINHTLEDVLALLPDARRCLSLLWIEPIGPDSPPIEFVHYDSVDPAFTIFYPRKA